MFFGTKFTAVHCEVHYQTRIKRSFCIYSSTKINQRKLAKSDISTYNMVTKTCLKDFLPGLSLQIVE